MKTLLFFLVGDTLWIEVAVGMGVGASRACERYEEEPCPGEKPRIMLCELRINCAALFEPTACDSDGDLEDERDSISARLPMSVDPIESVVGGDRDVSGSSMPNDSLTTGTSGDGDAAWNKANGAKGSSAFCSLIV